MNASRLRSAFYAVFTVAFFAQLLWNVHAIRYRPIGNISARIDLTSLVSAAAITAVAMLAVNMLRKPPPDELSETTPSSSGKMHPLMAFACGTILGGMCLDSWACTLNAWLDRTEPHVRQAEVTQREITSRYGIFHSYRLSYRFTNEPKSEGHSFSCTEKELDSAEPPYANLVYREGAFGWPWIETVKPADDIDLQK